MEQGLDISGTCGIRIRSIMDLWKKGLYISGTCGIRIRYFWDLWNKDKIYQGLVE